jgi:rod shape-determining protein MreB
MVVDIGGGTSEIAILSLNGVVYAESVKLGGDKMDEAITSWIRRNFGCVIGESTAEKIKQTIGCCTEESDKLEMQVTGRNLAEGIPETFTLNSDQVFDAMKDPLLGIVRAIRNALELAPPELAADIAERGIVLTGGGGLMRDLDKLISNSTGIPVIVAEDPLTCVARGGGQALEIIDKYDIDLLSTE